MTPSLVPSLPPTEEPLDYDVDRDRAVRQTARRIIERYDAADTDGLTADTYAVWYERPDVLLDAMFLWFQFGVRFKGSPYVARLVRHMTESVSLMEVDEPGSRAVFCDVLWAMFDRSQIRAMDAWMAVHRRGDWPVACEVVSLMLSYVGHFIGEPQGSATTEGTA